MSHLLPVPEVRDLTSVLSSCRVHLARFHQRLPVLVDHMDALIGWRCLNDLLRIRGINTDVLPLVEHNQLRSILGIALLSLFNNGVSQRRTRVIVGITSVDPTTVFIRIILIDARGGILNCLRLCVGLAISLVGGSTAIITAIVRATVVAAVPRRLPTGILDRLSDCLRRGWCRAFRGLPRLLRAPCHQQRQRECRSSARRKLSGHPVLTVSDSHWSQSLRNDSVVRMVPRVAGLTIFRKGIPSPFHKLFHKRDKTKTGDAAGHHRFYSPKSAGKANRCTQPT